MLDGLDEAVEHSAGLVVFPETHVPGDPDTPAVLPLTKTRWKSGLHSISRRGGGTVDAAGLKPAVPQGTWGFEPLPRHSSAGYVPAPIAWAPRVSASTSSLTRIGLLR